jgi:peptide/nickel transport system substrate-binding protein
MTHHLRPLAATAFFLLATAAALGGSAPASHAETRPLVIADAAGDYGLLAPFTHARNGLGYMFTSYVFDTLAAQGRDGLPSPGLATSWSVSADGLVWDMTLDPRAQWHDGQPVTAEDVAFTFDYMARHPYSFASLAVVSAAEVLSPETVRVTLTQPDAGFVTGTLVSLPILPRHVYDEVDEPALFADPAAATGSGPYRLVSYDKANGRYELARNDDYHLAEPLFPSVMIVRMTTDAAIAALAAGQIDVVRDIPADRTQAVTAAGQKVISAPSNHPTRLTFNQAGPFADKGARQALAHAIDRQRLVDIAYRGAAVVADTGYFQPGSPWHDPTMTDPYMHDPARAAVLLEGLGWSRNGDGGWQVDGQPLMLRLVTPPQFEGLATALADDLAAFGLPLDIRLTEPAQLQQVLAEGAFDLALVTSSTRGDPGGMEGRVFGNATNADRFPPHPALLDLLRAQASANSAEDRLDLLHRLARLYAEELPSLMLVNPVWATAHSDRVTPSFLPDGIAIGIPLSLHKAMLLP